MVFLKPFLFAFAPPMTNHWVLGSLVGVRLLCRKKGCKMLVDESPSCPCFSVQTGLVLCAFWDLLQLHHTRNGFSTGSMAPPRPGPVLRKKDTCDRLEEVEIVWEHKA